jgi:stage V sporulation protein G
MEVTEVRIFPRESRDKKLKAYATITFDDSFVVRDIKIIQGNKGIFVAMPSRKLRQSCPKCGHRNVIRSKYCNQCGAGLPEPQEPKDKEERQREHRDMAHPINSEFRDYLQKTVLEKYEQEAGAEEKFQEESTLEETEERRMSPAEDQTPEAPPEESAEEEPNI